MKAAKKGSLEIVEYLLDNGASINRTSSANDCTPLSLACSKGWIKIIECLLERGANRHSKLKDGITPLLEAVKSGNADAADLVLYYQPANAEFREVSSQQRGHVRLFFRCFFQILAITFIFRFLNNLRSFF
jgi:ankyrin repeat protein